MTLEDLQKVLESLKELEPDVEKFSWGSCVFFCTATAGRSDTNC
jgi:hypothetical protein